MDTMANKACRDGEKVQSRPQLLHSLEADVFWVSDEAAQIGHKPSGVSAVDDAVVIADVEWDHWCG
jgi:hypothetical protein